MKINKLKKIINPYKRNMYKWKIVEKKTKRTIEKFRTKILARKRLQYYLWLEKDVELVEIE